MVCRTDVYGGYYWNGSKWVQLLTYAGLGSGATVNGSFGFGELQIDPSNSANLWCMSRDLNYVTDETRHAIYKSTNSGAALTPSLAYASANADPNGTYTYKQSNGKIVVDPNQSQVVYAGMPFASTPNKVQRTINGGSTWSTITDVMDSTGDPGSAGICFDPSYKVGGSNTISVGGQLRTRRVLLPSAGVGVWESLDGGQTFTRSCTGQAFTPLTLSTSGTNRVVVVVAGGENGIVTGVSSPSLGAFTLRKAIQSTATFDSIYPYLSVYWAKAPAQLTNEEIKVYWSGLPGSSIYVAPADAFAFSVAGANTTNPFDVNGSLPGSFVDRAGMSISTTASNTLIYTASVLFDNDTGFTLLFSSNGGGAQPWRPHDLGSAYEVFSSPQSPSATLMVGAYGGIADAFVQAAGGTLSVDGATAGDAYRPRSPIFLTSGPSGAFQGTIDSNGVYYCVAPNGFLFRYSGAGGTWAQLDTGTGYNSSAGTGIGWLGTTGIVAADPTTPGHVVMTSSSALHGFASTNADASDFNAVTWSGTTGGPSGTFVAPSNDVRWQQWNGIPFATTMQFDASGVLWWSGAQGFWYFTNYNWTWDGGAHVSSTSVARGMEETCTECVICPPGASFPIIGMQDMGLAQGMFSEYPDTYYQPGNRNDCYSLDYAQGTPGFVVALTAVEGSGPAGAPSVYSTDYGAHWTAFGSDPFTAYSQPWDNYCLGAICACDTSHIVAIWSGKAWNAAGNASVPVHSANGGASWALSTGTGLSQDYNLFNIENRMQPLCADRVNAAKVYIYCMGNSTLYRSTDYGATFAATANTVSISPSGRCFLLSTPGYEGHLWLTGGGATSLKHSEDGGDTWTSVAVPGSVAVLLGMGKTIGASATPANYPTLFIYNGIFYYSTDKGTTWNSFGTRSDLPISCQVDNFQCLSGDWNAFGRVYVGGGSSGFCYYSL
jgi:hypothetical protein